MDNKAEDLAFNMNGKNIFLSELKMNSPAKSLNYNAYFSLLFSLQRRKLVCNLLQGAKPFGSIQFNHLA